MGETYDRKLVYSKVRPARGTVEIGDRFGSAVAFLRPTLEFGYDERLVVGAPGEDIGALRNAGAVRTVPLYMSCEHACGSDAYPDDSEAATVIQGRGKTPGVAGNGNQFGAAVSHLQGVDRGIIVAAPGQTVASKAGAGAIAVLDPVPTHSHQLDQTTRELPGESQADDRFGTLPSR